MSFHNRKKSNLRTVRLAVDELADRLTPAVYTWVGEPGTGFANWTTAADWDLNDGYPGGPGHTGDTPKFDTLGANSRAPKIYTGTSITIDNMTVTSNWTRDIAIDGTLTVKKSDSAGEGALTGDGTVTFDSGDTPAGVHSVIGSWGSRPRR